MFWNFLKMNHADTVDVLIPVVYIAARFDNYSRANQSLPYHIFVLSALV